MRRDIHDDVIKWKHFPRYWPLVWVPGVFHAQRPVTRSFDVFFDLRLNKRLSKQSWGWWFETLSCPLWRHRNVLSKWGPGNMWCHASTKPSVNGGFPSQRTSNEELVFFLCYWSEQAVEQTVWLSVIWDAMTLIWRDCNEIATNIHLYPKWKTVWHILGIYTNIFECIYIYIHYIYIPEICIRNYTPDWS